MTTKRKQIESYRNGSGLMLSIHITHHAGTTLCAFMRSVVSVPSFSCMADKERWPLYNKHN
eukprot:CAMPEP_0194154696 /NCGR_PEP_ID=MMETSP0152-20130528/61547_1 /TAXON_ID=1049557 /ORGANISM="Thalassiothrix antarctica, Strain L6-D1" /LENGTH=60 /DNA_ID=CAMNT_0038860961 /DNA_START=80 /DNA_END=259 /DNA_ORIENTATION=-